MSSRARRRPSTRRSPRVRSSSPSTGCGSSRARRRSPSSSTRRTSTRRSGSATAGSTFGARSSSATSSSRADGGDHPPPHGAAGFLDIQTPILYKSTPEGARDFVVPSRLHKGKFFALPQSPQILKQLTMIAGFDRYYQIAICFRDEDLRADRVQEITQLDVEMSFPDRELLFALMEEMFAAIWRECLGVEIPTPWPRLTYAEVDRRSAPTSPTRASGSSSRTRRRSHAGRSSVSSRARRLSASSVSRGRSRAPRSARSRSRQGTRREGTRVSDPRRRGELRSPIAKFLRRPSSSRFRQSRARRSLRRGRVEGHVARPRSPTAPSRSRARADRRLGSRSSG